MNSTTRLTLTTVLLASATLVTAQTPAQTLADRYRVLQSYTGSTPYQLRAPEFSNKRQDPTTGLKTAELQAQSSGSPMWRPNQVPASRGPTFVQANPHGLPFDYYQAAAADSDAFKYSPSADEPAFATATSDNTFAGHSPTASMRIATDKAAKR